MESAGIVGNTAIVIQNATTMNFSLTNVNTFVDQFFNVEEMGTKTLSPQNNNICTCSPTGQIQWSIIRSVSRNTVTGGSLKSLIMTSGKQFTSSGITKVMVKSNNIFMGIGIANLDLETAVPSSLYLPNRVAYQTSTFNVVIEMSMSAQDPQANVPIFTNTWGYLALPLQLVQRFLNSTRDVDDILTLTNVISEQVTYNVIDNVIPVVSPPVTQMVYTINTDVGNFMVDNGIFVVTTV